MTQKQIKTALEEVAFNALSNSIKEQDITKDAFSEEALRYLTMLEISKKNIWGTFPNKKTRNGKKEHRILAFEKLYRRDNINNKFYFPDIVSYHETKKNHNLAVELKINKDNKDKDIKKCKEYLDKNSGDTSFNLAMVLFSNKPKTDLTFDMKKKIKSASRKGISIENSTLLIGFIEWKKKDEKSNIYFGEPKTFWI